MTKEQQQQFIVKARKQGYTPQQIDSYLKAKQQGGFTSQQSTRQDEKKQQGDGFLKSLVKDPVKTLIVKPGVRIAQAGVAAFGAATGNERLASVGERDASVKLPGLGKFDIEAQRTGSSGVKQIAGDAAKTASYLYTPVKGATALKSGLAANVGKGFAQGSVAGGVGGGLYMGGQAAIDNKSGEDIAAETIKGVGLGSLTGGVVGAGVGMASATTRAASNKVRQGVASVRSSVDDLAQNDSSIIGRNIRSFKEAGETRKILATKPEHIKDAVKVGVPIEQAELIGANNAETKRSMTKMLDTHNARLRNPIKNKQAVNVVGENLVEQAKHLNKVRATAGQKMGELYDALPNTKFETRNTQQVIREGFEEMGVTITKDGLNFDSSILTGAKERAILEDVFARISSKKGLFLTKANARVIRDRIRNDLELGARNGELGSYSQSFFGKLREGILKDVAESGGKAGQEYAKQSKVYAETIGALGNFYKTLGLPVNEKNIGLTGLRAGEVANRILGNASARPEAIIDGLVEAAKKYGYKGTVDTKMLIYFNDFLEEVLGSTQTRSLQGQAARAGSEVVKDVITGNKMGLLDKALKSVTGTTKSEVERAIRKLLN